MKLLTVATKMDIKVDATVTKAIKETTTIIKKAVVVDKAKIKISTKVTVSSGGAKILAHNKKLIKKIAHKKQEKRTHRAHQLSSLALTLD